MTAAELLRAMVSLLDDAGIPHMLAGSVASSFHGEPRSTQDIDLVIDPDERSLTRFLDRLDRDRYFVDDAIDALRRRGQFDVIDTMTGWKVDLVIRKERSFSREEFARRRSVEVLCVATYIASAEDTVLAKLEWAKAGGSERQIEDVVGVLSMAHGSLDENYLDHWAAELGVTDQLDRARSLSDQ